ncbi:uncharacterized protein LOC107272412 [Cephus cinctus]|uniref:Uncharacterized protein LOC107272412 n=1 Tax=Cephus cinctus TaxID=211228 RepID=A0AAJ7FRS9_CEPCN|nr:uncharacterized protein LOC107272412 [Cephus cinctus]
MLKAKCSRFTECFCRRPGFVLMLLPCLLLLTLYLISGSNVELEGFHYLPFKSYNGSGENIDGYLVWNPKCHMLSNNPLDPSIRNFVKQVKFEACTTSPLLSGIEREANGSCVLRIDPHVSKNYKNLTCCWAPIVRPKPTKTSDKMIDSKISVEVCTDFKTQVLLPDDVEAVMVSCKAYQPDGGAKRKSKLKNQKELTNVYKNVHAVLNLAKVQDRIGHKMNISSQEPRKLSILILGIDSVSQSNMERTMPRTTKHLIDTDWIRLSGYNKMGENTFPNLMAILTGFNISQAYSQCAPTVLYKLDNCPFIWYAFRNAGYVTGYGEDSMPMSTFNYLKVGFADPPTDYYMRPYVVASEKLLKLRRKFSTNYCTGPELSVERILNFAVEFARTLIGIPYFGFFWTNAISHDSMNAPSSMDDRILRKFQLLEREGVFNDSMIVFLSDHGMRYGDIRDTLVGWYEERLPFFYIRLPDWFREENPDVYAALRVNQNRLTSPYDFYETLRDILVTAGGEANSSSGCPTCMSLFRRVPWERGCEDVGVSSHWCTCTAFRSVVTNSKIAAQGAQKFLEHVENIIKNYKDSKGNRLCAKLKLKKLVRVDKVVDSSRQDAGTDAYFYMLQTTPGGAKYEATIRHHGDGNYSISDDEVNRINSYASSSKCLERGFKQYCYCIK